MHPVYRLFTYVLVCALALTALPIQSVQAQSGRRTYVVQPGDTLFSIAARFGVSVSELATINGFYDIHRLFVGQVLILPAPITTPRPAVPALPISQPVFTQPIFPPGTTVTTVTTFTAYTVRSGDTLAEIAARFGTTVAAILSANGIRNPNLIFVGQVLNIPRTRTTIVPARRTHVRRGRTYIVQPGDTLFLIAARFHRNVYDIARANNILNLNQIFVGQVLVIP
ncbi:MAG: LysM peptidoglycan-binding domain-containing protein [Anaerolineae bacterium]|nr:LysM peptidoglycan-binding domain-containing protein [Anaerolineae bacterium]MDW8300421.1 LysM peptidoglycan-binding domain-containing protein [Anaerolineae bacterium]